MKKLKLIFAGTPDFAVPCLQALIDENYDVCAVYTQPDRPAGRGRHLTPSPIKQCALQYGIPVFQPLSFKSDEELNELSAFQADLMIVVAYGMILPQTVLDTPALGCINVHASLLPRWRGAAPIQRAIVAGDKQTGVTIMKVVKKLDAGDMLHKTVYDIKPNDTANDVHNHLSVLGAKSLLTVLEQIQNQTLQSEAQDENFVTYAAKLEKSEAMIDWTQSAQAIDQKIRGFNPYPVAQTLYNSDILRIWKAQLINEKTQLSAGTVKVTGKNIDIATGQGMLRLVEIQLPGGKRLSSEAFLAAHKIDGMVLN